MWAYARVTAKDAVLSPVTWGLCLLGVFFGWFATTLAILALVEIEGQGEALVISTSQLFGALLTLSLLGRTLEEDSTSGFTLAGDATAAGPQGRLLGRWVGACTGGVVMTLIVAALTASTGAAPMPPIHYLLYTTTLSIAVVGAWAVLLASQWNGAAGGLIVLLLWILGHLPWGTAPFAEGTLGRALAAWLPGPRPVDGGWSTLGYTSATVAGLLLLARVLARPAEPRS